MFYLPVRKDKHYLVSKIAKITYWRGFKIIIYKIRYSDIPYEYELIPMSITAKAISNKRYYFIHKPCLTDPSASGDIELAIYFAQMRANEILSPMYFKLRLVRFYESKMF